MADFDFLFNFFFWKRIFYLIRMAWLVLICIHDIIILGWRIAGLDIANVVLQVHVIINIIIIIFEILPFFHVIVILNGTFCYVFLQ